MTEERFLSGALTGDDADVDRSLRPRSLGEFPAVKRWIEACQARPAFQKMWQARLAEPA